MSGAGVGRESDARPVFSCVRCGDPGAYRRRMFGRGFKLFTLFGIPVYLDVSFFIIVPLFAWLLSSSLPVYGEAVNLGEQTRQAFDLTQNADGGYDVGRSGLAFVFGALVTLGLYASVLVHEFGHALTAKRFGVKTERVTLWFLGGIASFERMPRQPGAEAIVRRRRAADEFRGRGRAVAGRPPVARRPVRVAARRPHAVGGQPGAGRSSTCCPRSRSTAGGFCGRCSRWGCPTSARRRSVRQSASSLHFLLGLSAFFTGSLFAVAIAIFIWLAVNAETRQSVVETLLKGVRVGDLMVRDVETMSPDAPAAGLFDEMIRRRHLGFPVVDADRRVLGVIGLRDLTEPPPPGASVADVMHTQMCVMPPAAPAQAAFDEMGRRGFARCVVADDEGKLVGLLTKADLMRLIQVRTAATAAASMARSD